MFTGYPHFPPSCKAGDFFKVIKNHMQNYLLPYTSHLPYCEAIWLIGDLCPL